MVSLYISKKEHEILNWEFGRYSVKLNRSSVNLGMIPGS